MDVLWFLKQRTNFIRQFYATAAGSFDEIIRKIEAEEEPFIPVYSEDDGGEPPFLTEWQEADASLQILGKTCISLLSDALKLYLQTWEAELGVKWTHGDRERYFKDGFVRGYQRRYGEVLGITWNKCSVDFDLLEQITLARNASQHPNDITHVEGRHDMKTRARFAAPARTPASLRRAFIVVFDRDRYSLDHPNPHSGAQTKRWWYSVLCALS